MGVPVCWGLGVGCARVLGLGYWVCLRAVGLGIGCARVLWAWVTGVPAC